jgi:hypothetical protein
MKLSPSEKCSRDRGDKRIASTPAIEITRFNKTVTARLSVFSQGTDPYVSQDFLDPETGEWNRGPGTIGDMQGLSSLVVAAVMLASKGES